MKNRNIAYITLAVLGVLTACTKNSDIFYNKVSENRLPVIVANTNFTTPTLVAAGTTTVTGGSTIAVELDYLQTDPIKQIQFLQKIGAADSTVISTIPYASAFSKGKQCDTLLYTYNVPALTVAPVGTSVTVRARVVNQTGLYRDKLFIFKTK